MPSNPNEKLFSRTEYRRVIAWPERIQRESPFLRRVLRFPGLTEGAPQSLLDLGCGTGEHSRHFAKLGWSVVGVDSSEKMIDDAKDLEGQTERGGRVRYELRSAAEAGEISEAPFQSAICLGNTLAFVHTSDELHAFVEGVANALVEGAPFLIQMLNYGWIGTPAQRTLPVNFRELPEEEGDGEIVFLRVFGENRDGHLDFYPITLTLRPDQDPPVEVRSAKKGQHTAWTREDLAQALQAHGFQIEHVLGGMSLEREFLAQESQDLVVIARRDDRSAPSTNLAR